jgi:putative MATE family efflux protein
MKGENRDLILNGSLPKAILSVAVPVVVNSFLQTMYNLTDTYWLGRIGTEQLAAINLVTPMQNIVISFGGGVTVAGVVMIAQYVGAKLDDEARKMTAHIFLCAMGFSLLFASLVVLFSPGIVGWLGADGSTYPYGVTYLRIVSASMPFLFMMNIYQAVLQAQGNTVSSMLLNFLGITVNMALDPLLMIAYPLGVAGAALATLVAKLIPAVLAFRLLRSRRQLLRLSFKGFRFEREKLKNIARIGLPTALGGSTMHLGFMLMSKSVYAYGVDAMAAYGIGNKVNGLISLPSNAIGSAISTIAGQNMGARQPERTRKAYLWSMTRLVAFLLAGGLILSRPAVAQAIVSVFSDDPAVVAMAADFLSILAFWCFANGVYNSTAGLFRATGHTEITTAVDVSRLWVFRFGTLYLCQNVFLMGVRSVWYSIVISNGITAAILLALYFTGLWRKPRFEPGRQAGAEG